MTEVNWGVVERLWAEGGPVVYAVWHGRMLTIPARYASLPRFHVLASRSRDGGAAQPVRPGLRGGSGTGLVVTWRRTGAPGPGATAASRGGSRGGRAGRAAAAPGSSPRPGPCSWRTSGMRPSSRSGSGRGQGPRWDRGTGSSSPIRSRARPSSSASRSGSRPRPTARGWKQPVRIWRRRCGALPRRPIVWRGHLVYLIYSGVLLLLALGYLPVFLVRKVGAPATRSRCVSGSDSCVCPETGRGSGSTRYRWVR